MSKVSRLETLVNFGFTDNPFRRPLFKTGDGHRIERILKMAVKERAMVSVVGDRGSGKTCAVTTAFQKMRVRQVNVRSADKSRLLISDIEQAIILDLSDEKPKRGREIRARQLRRVIGEASTKQDIVLVIEEGHRLHGMTLRSLKTLREMDWMGKRELFTVVLIGQSDSMSKPGISEVRLRSDTVQMHGLTGGEVEGYIRATVGRVFNDDANRAISHIPASKNFLDLQDIIVRLMAAAFADGRKTVELKDVENQFSEYASAFTTVESKTGKPSQKQDVNAKLKNILNRSAGEEDSKGIQAVG